MISGTVTGGLVATGLFDVNTVSHSLTFLGTCLFYFGAKKPLVLNVLTYFQTFPAY